MGEAIEELGFGFLFARVFHPAMRHVAPVRAELGVRTVFNLLGPLTNPAGADAYVLGVFSPEWLAPMAEALERLGARGLVVHGEGADELVLGENRVVEVGKGAYALTPEEVGLKRAPRGPQRRRPRRRTRPSPAASSRGRRRAPWPTPWPWPRGPGSTPREKPPP